MMDMSDWASGFIGGLVFLLGLIPLIEMFTALNLGVTSFLQSSIPTTALPYLLAILGFYLAIESIIELTNSNSIGWISFLIGGVVMLAGLLPAIASFEIGPGFFGFVILALAYYIIFIVEGFFLMIAMFAMEL